MNNAIVAKAALLTTLVAVFAGFAGSASAAETQWQKDHPRRAEVNARLAKQDSRVKTDVKQGELTKPQAAALHKDDRQIRHEERAMASQNGGHITKTEKLALNQQENAVSKQIPK